MTESLPRIGFIGLGIMGRPMARNLLKAGYPLVVHDVNRDAVAEIAACTTCVKPSSRRAVCSIA